MLSRPRALSTRSDTPAAIRLGCPPRRVGLEEAGPVSQRSRAPISVHGAAAAAPGPPACSRRLLRRRRVHRLSARDDWRGRCDTIGSGRAAISAPSPQWAAERADIFVVVTRPRVGCTTLRHGALRGSAWSRSATWSTGRWLAHAGRRRCSTRWWVSEIRRPIERPRRTPPGRPGGAGATAAALRALRARRRGFWLPPSPRHHSGTSAGTGRSTAARTERRHGLRVRIDGDR